MTRSEEAARKVEALKEEAERKRQSLLKSDVEKEKEHQSEIAKTAKNIPFRLNVLGWNRSRCKRHIQLLEVAVKTNNRPLLEDLISRAPVEFFEMVKIEIETAHKVDREQLKTVNKFIQMKKFL